MPSADDLEERWVLGSKIDEAAWEFGEPSDREAVRNGGNLPFYELRMLMDLFHTLFEKEIIAIGIRNNENNLGNLEIVPNIYFADGSRGAVERAMAGANSDLQFGMTSWTQVRIVRSWAQPELGSLPKMEKKLGRPRVDGVLAGIVDRLGLDGQLTGKSRKEQENLVRQTAQKTHAHLFPKDTQPSRTKILEALKAYEERPAAGQSKKSKKFKKV